MSTPRVWLITKHSDGFSVVEVLLAATIFGMLVTALIGALVYGQAASVDAGEQARANMLAEEGVEAVRNIRDAAYANLVDGTYGLVQSGGTWTLSGASDTTGIFTRQVTISTVDTVRKLVTATVSWPTLTGTAQVSVSSRLTNWLAALPVQKSWSNAIVAGSANPTGTIAGLKVDTSGNYAYMVENTATSSFVIVNISNPAAPSVVSTTTLSNTATNIAVSGNYAYITTNIGTSGLLIYDISNPAAPSLVKTLGFIGSAAVKGIYISGNFAYVVRAGSSTTNSNEFKVVNITTPPSASLVGGYNNNNTMNEVWVSGNFAYVAESATSTSIAEMVVINVTTPSSPTLAASYNPTGTNTVLTITGSGSTVYLGYASTVNSVNITTPTSPTTISTLALSGAVQDLDIDGANDLFAGTADTAGEFQIINVTTPSAMTLTKKVDVTGTTSTVNGVSYDSSLDVVAGASASTTQRLLVFTKN